MVKTAPGMRLPAVGAYVAMIAATAAIFFVITHYGRTLAAPPPPVPASAPAHTEVRDSSIVPAVVAALAAVIVLGRLLGLAFRQLRQPPAIFEVVAGVVLGPSLLGRVAPSLVLPASASPLLGSIAQIGVVVYMFIVGLEL